MYSQPHLEHSRVQMIDLVKKNSNYIYQLTFLSHIQNSNETTVDLNKVIYKVFFLFIYL